MAVGQNGGKGLGTVLPDKLRERFSLDAVEVDDQSRAGLTAHDARASLPRGSDPPDVVVVALGTADALAFDPATFREAMERLLDMLLDRTDALIVVVAPARIPHSNELARADECGSADTADPAWQMASLLTGRGIAVVDADKALDGSGLPVTKTYADNLSLTDSGHEIIASAIVRLLHRR